MLPLLAFTAAGIMSCTPALAEPEAPSTAVWNSAPGLVVFTDVNVVPMDRERILEGQTVIVRDGRIAAVGTSPHIVVPPGATIVDGTGRYLMPGLAEMHAHVPGPQTDVAVLEQMLFLFVANGVTTIRGMLGHPMHLDLRERIVRGEVLGPMFIVGAPSLNGNSAPDAETGRRLVREHAAAGYDFLKLHPGLTRPVYDAIVETAREVGITWAGHVSTEVGLEHTLATRQSTIDHLDGYLTTAVSDGMRARLARGEATTREVLHAFDHTRARALAETSARAGVWNVPTMYLWETFLSATPPEDFMHLPEMRYAPTQMREAWVQQKRNQLRQQDEAGVSADDRRLNVQHRRTILRMLAEAGAPLMLGSDAPQMFNVPGFSIHREVEVMRAAGLTPWEILRSGTRNVAHYAATDLGLEGDFGRVSPGDRADLLLLNGNPLQDIGRLQDRAGVMIAGRWISEAEIQRHLEEIARTNAR